MCSCLCETVFPFFFFNEPPPTEIYTLSLHDALPIWPRSGSSTARSPAWNGAPRSTPVRTCTSRSCGRSPRSEEHTSELQSRFDLVCRLLLEKKKKHSNNINLHNSTHAYNTSHSTQLP